MNQQTFPLHASVERAIEHYDPNEWQTVVTVVNIHDVKSHGGNTQKWNTSAVHDIVGFRYQGMNVITLYLKG